MNDLTLKYKADTGKKRSDIELDLKTNNGKISISTEAENYYGDEFRRLGLSIRFLDAFEYQEKHDGEIITITDPDYVAWLESELTSRI